MRDTTALIVIAILAASWFYPELHPWLDMIKGYLTAFDRWLRAEWLTLVLIWFGVVLLVIAKTLEEIRDKV